MYKVKNLYKAEICGKMLALALVVMLATGLTGCAGRDLRDVELAQGLAVDVRTGEKTDENNAENVANMDIYNKEEKISVEVQLLHRDKALEGQYAASYYAARVQGSNLGAALGLLTAERSVNLSHLQVLAVGADVPLANWLDGAMSSEVRPTVYPVVVRGRAADLLDGAGELAAVYQLAGALEPEGSGRAGAMAVTLQEFAVKLTQPGVATALPYAELAGGVNIGGLAVWDEAAEEWVCIADGDECLAWRLLMAGSRLGAEVLELGGGLAVELDGARAKWELTDDGWRCAVRVRGRLLANPQDLPQDEVAGLLRGRVERALAAGLALSVRDGLDYLGLGREVWRRRPELWRQMAGEDYLAGWANSGEFAVDVEVRAVDGWKN